MEAFWYSARPPMKYEMLEIEIILTHITAKIIKFKVLTATKKQPDEVSLHPSRNKGHTA
jgi:hypothetical protein